MIGAQLVRVWRRYIRHLGTDKEHVGVAERWAGTPLLIVMPYFGNGFGAVHPRAALWKPSILDATSVAGIHLRCRLPAIIQKYVYLFGVWEPDLTAFMRRRLQAGAHGHRHRGRCRVPDRVEQQTSRSMLPPAVNSDWIDVGTLIG